MVGEEHVGALTAGERSHWAHVRQTMFNRGHNRTSLHCIERAAFNVCLGKHTTTVYSLLFCGGKSSNQYSRSGWRGSDCRLDWLKTNFSFSARSKAAVLFKIQSHDPGGAAGWCAVRKAILLAFCKHSLWWPEINCPSYIHFFQSNLNRSRTGLWIWHCYNILFYVCHRLWSRTFTHLIY